MRLEEDLEGEIDGAATLDEADRVVQVDLVRGGENGGGLGVVTDAYERLCSPLFNDLDFDAGSVLELCRGHDRLFQRRGSTCVYVRIA